MNVVVKDGEIDDATQVRKQICEGIRISDSRYLFHELEQQRRVRKWLAVSTALSTLASVIACGVLAFSLIGYWQLRQSLTEIEDRIEEANGRSLQLLSEIARAQSEIRAIERATKEQLVPL